MEELKLSIDCYPRYSLSRLVALGPWYGVLSGNEPGHSLNDDA